MENILGLNKYTENTFLSLEQKEQWKQRGTEGARGPTSAPHTKASESKGLVMVLCSLSAEGASYADAVIYAPAGRRLVHHAASPTLDPNEPRWATLIAYTHSRSLLI